ncbi:heme biosynthesis HemY N-terminal domain-containing protein [uncultured Bartonella sp.]|uniref:heme biosynthesis protein HemY n=1 Tax=uncultured Bartonella sp. TaxID=104108 RepID=UPI002612663D|nr:heme biosynthesis HemY N-terminal domain-containing protein [uncultured Bartonella sp.]
MVRVLLYILVVAVLGAGFAWLANNPGSLVMTFGANRVTVSVLTAVIFFVLLVVVVLFLLWLLKSLFSAPSRLVRHFEEQRLKKGREALSNGLLAVLSGDSETAKHMNKRVTRFLDSDSEPLAKLLDAKTLLLEKDIPNALRIYEEMTRSPQTRLAGLHGLYREAIKSGAFDAAGQYAEKATYIAPSVAWANQAMLNRLCMEGSWDKAIDLFERAVKSLPRGDRADKKLNHKRVVLLTGQAMEMLENYPDDARKIALKAQKLEPSFVPTTLVACDILYRQHEMKKADRFIETLWKKTPTIELATLYLNESERAVDRLKKAKTLAAKNPDAYESRFIVAHAAFDAGELPFARNEAEKALKIAPRESAYLLLADIEEAQTGDQGKIRQWLSRAVRAENDPVWMADGQTFERWHPVSPLSGKLDAFVWQAPLRNPGLTLNREELEFPAITITATEKEQPAIDEPDNKNSATETKKQATEAEKPTKVHRNVAKPEQKFDVKPAMIVDAIDPSKPDIPDDVTRINVDDPGVHNK